MTYKTEYNQTLEKLRSVYEYYKKFDVFVGKEFTFTVAPGRCQSIQDIKKKIMRMCVGRMIHSKPIAFMLTRENHENGWPHVHGIGWYLKDEDNSLTVTGGRMFVMEREQGKKYASKYYMYSELGRIQVNDLRTEPYVDTKDESWNDWLEYICKDQEVKWREANVLVQSEEDIRKFFSKLKVEDFVD